jgi:hypothetical protein
MPEAERKNDQAFRTDQANLEQKMPLLNKLQRQINDFLTFVTFSIS